jgi:TPR repeat protein
MKRKATLLVWMLLLLLINAGATDYKILKMSCDSIKIGNRWCRKGSVFNDADNIRWPGGYHFLWAQNQSTQKTFYISSDAMNAKSTRTLKDYVLRLNKMSSRDGEIWQNLIGKNKENFTEKRIALVIGNSNYQNNTQLRNAINDAHAVSAELQQLGFDVYSLYDGTGEDMENAVELFRKKAVGNGYKMALFYYSGHGLQGDDGNNYLLPVDAKLNSKGDLSTCIDGRWLVSKLADANCANTIVVLDACRNEKLNWTRGLTDGLIPLAPPLGMLLAYSTQAGSVAQDMINDDLPYGPYANALVAALKKDKSSVDELFSEVKSQVIQSTSAIQVPTIFNNLLKTVYINGQNQYEVLTPEQARAEAKKAFDSRVQLAEQGDREAQYELGMAYEFGSQFCDTNRADAYKWYTKAANQGHTEAENKLGTYYFLDKNNLEEAVNWYELAAKGGNGNAQYNLGFIYLNATGSLSKPAEGLEWMRSAAESGVANAQYELGRCYYDGIDGLQIPYRTEAYRWFKAASEQDHLESHYYVGRCYFYGEGTDQNYSEAFKHYKIAADKGMTEAEYALALCYEKGYGVDPNKEAAIAWCKKAAAKGYDKAIRRLSILVPEGQ